MPATLIAAVFFAGDAILMAAALGSAGLAAASFAVTFVISSLFARAFAPGDPGANVGLDSGVRQQNPPAPTNNIPIVYGDAYLGGTFVDAVLSIDQKTMYYVLAISSIAESSSQFVYDTTKFYYGDRTIAFDTTDLTKVISLTDGAANVDTKIAGKLFIYLYKSSYAGSIVGQNTSVQPSTLMGGANINVDQRWPATNRQMNGLAFAIVVLSYSRDAQTTQMQPITFKVGQYLNGTSAAYPGAVWLDYITSRTYGGGMDIGIVDAVSGDALDTYSQELITFTSSSGAPSTQPRYKINGVLDTGQNVLQNIDRIMLACDSWNQYNAATGKWSVVINKATASTFAFDDSNVIGEIKTSLLDLSNSINEIEAQFPSKLNRDQRDVVYLETPTGLLYPNEPINKYSCNFDLVNDSVQASYLANRILEQAREDLIVTISAAYPAIQVDAGDIVTLTNAAYGWNAKLFRVMKVSEISLPDGNLGATLDLSEYNAQVYDNADITQYSPAPNSNLPSVNYFSALTAPTVTSSTPTGGLPSFDVRVLIPATGRVTYGELFYATSPTPAITDWQFLSMAGRINGDAVAPGTYYTFKNQVLPTGASTTATYYFAYVVGNDIGRSEKSPVSAAFSWTPVGTPGDNGLTAANAYRVQSQSAAPPTFTTPTSGSAVPAGWSATASSLAVGQVMWYLQGRYNDNAVAVDGVVANTTEWTGPIAASIFQDIRSDNWNGSNPPTFGTPATYGTAGYYIQRTTGDVYFNNGVFRADINTDGQAIFSGNNNSSLNFTIAGTNYNIYFSAFGRAPATAPVSGQVNAGMLGYADSIGSQYPVGVFGIGAGTRSIGVVGTGVGTGGYLTSPSASGNAAEIINTGGGNGLLLESPMIMTNSTLVTNLNANYLSGNLAAAFAKTFNTNSGTATVAASALDILGSTSTGIAAAYVGTTGAGSTVTLDIRTTSPSDVRLKKEIQNADLGLGFVNKLRPVSYKLKADPRQQKGYGFIADEVEELIGADSSLVYFEPDWQVGDEKGFKTIHYPSYIAVLTKAIQELSAEVEALKAKG